MEQAFTLLREKFNDVFNSSEIPVVAMILDQSNNVIDCSTNQRQEKREICSHAEINVINNLFNKNNSKNLKGYKILVNLEPCKMCIGAIEQTGLNEVIYFVDNKKFGAKKFADPRIKFLKIENDDTKYYEDKLVEYFRKLR